MAGPIAKEVVEELTSKVLPVKQVDTVSVKPGTKETWQTSPAPGSPPTQVSNVNDPKPWSAAWWWKNGGTTGIVCFLLVAGFGWLMNSQRDGQNAIINMMQTSEKNRTVEATRVIDGVIRTQENLTGEIHNMTRAIEKLDSRIETLPKKDPGSH